MAQESRQLEIRLKRPFQKTSPSTRVTIMKKTNTRNRKQGRNKFSPIDCMSDTFVLEKRELMAGGAPPAMVYRISGIINETNGLLSTETIQENNWQTEIGDSVSVNESMDIVKTGVKDFWKNQIVANISGNTSIAITQVEDTFNISQGLSQKYTPASLNNDSWPFYASGLYNYVVIQPYILKDYTTGGNHPYEVYIDQHRIKDDAVSVNNLNWQLGYDFHKLRDQTEPFKGINLPPSGGRLEIEYDGHTYIGTYLIFFEVRSTMAGSGPGSPNEFQFGTTLDCSITIKNLSVPDIAISDATYDEVNKNVWFDMELKNNPKDFNVKLYQSEDQSFDGSDDFVYSQSISSSDWKSGETAIRWTGSESVLSYSSLKNSVSLHLPDNFKYNPLKPYLVLVADPWTESTPRGEVTELEEKSNNVTSVMIMPSTDIKVTKLSFVSRGELEVEYDITGDIPVQPIKLDIYRSESTYFTYGKNQLITSITLPPSSRKVKIKGDFRIDPSRKFILAVADPENLIDENDSDVLNEDNSKSIRKFLLGAITHGYSITLFNYTSIDWMKQMRGAMIMKGYDSVLTHDWYEASDDKKRNVTVNEGYKFAQKIVTESKHLTNSAISKYGYDGNFLVDLHLIGHSRGAVVVTQAAIKLSTISESKLLFDHKKLTLLDPHPANSSTLKTFNVPTLNRIRSFYFPPFYNRLTAYNIWLAAQASINRYRSFCLAARDPNIEIPSFIDEAESYYQRSEVVLPLPTIAGIPDVLWVMNLHGIPVKGAKNTEITSLRPVNQHSDVYNWYINHKIYQF
jgi:hypothetical protein